MKLKPRTEREGLQMAYVLVCDAEFHAELYHDSRIVLAILATLQDFHGGLSSELIMYYFARFVEKYEN